MSSTTGRPSPEREGPRWSAWNLLLLVPFLMLVTPWFNSNDPELFGVPYFYWSQFVWVPVSVVCVTIVYLCTRDGRHPAASGAPGGVDELDEGAKR